MSQIELTGEETRLGAQSDVQKEHARLVNPLGDWRRTHHCCQLTLADNGREVCLMGWVQYRRDHGGLIFVDLRDREGLTQVVFSPEIAPDPIATPMCCAVNMYWPSRAGCVPAPRA